MGRVKAMIMDQEEKLNEYVWFIVSECETFQEFSFKVKLFAETECNLANTHQFQTMLFSESNNFNFLKEIIDLRMVNIFIDLEDLERAKKILDNNFTTYQTNKFILQGDIFAEEKKFKDAKKKYVDALARSENETQRNLINLKISTLTE